MFTKMRAGFMAAVAGSAAGLFYSARPAQADISLTVNIEQGWLDYSSSYREHNRSFGFNSAYASPGSTNFNATVRTELYKNNGSGGWDQLQSNSLPWTAMIAGPSAYGSLGIGAIWTCSGYTACTTDSHQYKHLGYLALQLPSGSFGGISGMSCSGVGTTSAECTVTRLYTT